MKPKREITFGRWKDECEKHVVEEGHPRRCIDCDKDIRSVCEQYRSGAYPGDFDLTDPPRFTEAQMALLKALWEIGAKKVKVGGMGIVALNEKGLTIYLADILREIEGETLDLAELFGEEGTK